MPGATIGKGVVVYKSIISSGVTIEDKAVIGSMEDTADKDYVNTKICSNDITLIGPDVIIGGGKKIAVNSMVIEDVK